MPKRTKKTNAETATGTEIALVVPEQKNPARAARAKAPGTKSKAEPKPAPPEDTASTEEQVVFAFRLTRPERDAIHAAAGPAKASRFVKGIALAAAQGDLDEMHRIVAEISRNK